jgi:predicted RNA-binding Zn ribbon-like protein
MTQRQTVPGETEFVALALVNSRHNSRAGIVDHLANPEILASWLAERSLVDSESAVSDDELHAAHRLRGAIRELVLARIEDRAPTPAAVATVNEAAAAAPAADQLQWEAPGRPRRRRASEAGDIARALAALAEDAIALVSGERHADLIACHAPGCVRLLLKDHPRREWCSTRCGDRVRAARYYRRHRGG